MIIKFASGTAQGADSVSGFLVCALVVVVFQKEPWGSMI